MAIQKEMWQMEWFEADAWVAVDVANNILLVSQFAGSEVGNAFPDPCWWNNNSTKFINSFSAWASI